MEKRLLGCSISAGLTAMLLMVSLTVPRFLVVAGFTPTPPPTEVPTATPTPLTPTTTPVPPTQPAPPPAETAVPTPTPTIPLLPESGGGGLTIPWAIILTLGAAAILTGWTVRRRKQKHRAIPSGTNTYR